MTPRPGRTGRLSVLALVAAALVVSGCARSNDAAASAEGALAGPGIGVDQGHPGTDTAGEAGKAADGVAVARDDTAATTPAVVVVGDLGVQVTDVRRATSDLSGLVTTYRGQVDAQSTQTAGTPGPEDDSTTAVVRVPPARVDAFVDDVAALGTLMSADINRSDVSAEVADVEVRLENARASVARVRALLQRAEQLSDVVLLEAEMSRRQADLEALEARARVLSDQTALATLTVRLTGGVVAVPVAEPVGFLAGLTAGWQAFTAATVGALTVLGVLTPFLALALLIAGAVLLALRASRRRREAPVEAAQG